MPLQYVLWHGLSLKSILDTLLLQFDFYFYVVFLLFPGAKYTCLFFQ